MNIKELKEKLPMRSNTHKKLGLMLVLSLSSTSLYAHDPIFGIGPHVLFKNGVELAADIQSDKTDNESKQAVAFDIKYGITGDWAIGFNLPYRFRELAGNKSNGKGDYAVSTKYRFWRKDSLGLQQSAAVLLKILPDSADKNKQPALDKGTSDTIVGLTYGYEGRRWYRWVSGRYRNNSKTKSGFHRGHKSLIDFVIAYRPTLTNYRDPDTVWLLELNGEFSGPAEQNAVSQQNSGGKEWFIAPGIFWTKRNFAIKAGVQLPVMSDLNGAQVKSTYRTKVTFEWHL